MEPERITPARRVRSLPSDGITTTPDTIVRPSSVSPLTSPDREMAPGKRETLCNEPPPPALYSPPKHHPSFGASYPGRPRFDSKTEQCESSFVYPDNTPLVFPFIPPPTLSLDEAALPDSHHQAEHATDKVQNAVDRPHVPDLSDQIKPSVDAADTEPAADATNPRCTLQYLRAIPSEQSRGYTLMHGQVWRAGNKRSGWRRNQWVVDGR